MLAVQTSAMKQLAVGLRFKHNIDQRFVSLKISSASLSPVRFQRIEQANTFPDSGGYHPSDQWLKSSARTF